MEIERCQFCNSPSKYVSHGCVISYGCGTVNGDQLPRTLTCAIEWALLLKRQLSKSIRIEHGDKGRCPTCFASGTFDIELHPDNPQLTNFTDSIWYNETGEGHWECHDCWLE